MAKKATAKPARPARVAAQSLSTAGDGCAAPVDSPAEGSGGAAPQVSLSDAEGMQMDAAGNVYAEGDLGAEMDILADEPGLVAADAEPDAELSEPIKQAQSYITPHGVPQTGEHHHYYTPPPPDLRRRK